MITRRLAILSVVAAAASPVLAVRAQAADAAAARIRSFYDTIEGAMKNAGRLGTRGRFNAITPAFQQTFDVPSMTRIAVGSSWGSIPGGKQAALQASFSRFLIATYAKRLDGYSGERFEVNPASEQRAGGRVVKSQVTESGGRVTAIDYLVNGGGRAVDVYLNGSISELATRRAEFESVLASGGPDALEADLRNRTERLLAS